MQSYTVLELLRHGLAPASFRTPPPPTHTHTEPTSLERVTGFNQENVKQFYDKVSIELSR
jgi:hypothetical protein